MMIIPDLGIKRQADGRRIREMLPPNKIPLNPSSVTIPLDRELQRDREKTAEKADEAGYLKPENRNRIIQFDYEDLIKKDS